MGGCGRSGHKQIADLFSKELTAACESLANGFNMIVHAESGGGKTAFGAAVLQHFQERGCLIWSGEGTAFGRTIPFGVATKILVQAGDREVLTQRFAGAAVAEIFIRRRIRELVEANRKKPIYLVIDDLHLVDEPSIDTIMWMLEALPIYALVTLPLAPDWGSDVRLVDPHKIAMSCIRLPKLGFEGTAQYVASLLPETIDMGLIGAVHALAAGNVGLVAQVVNSGVALGQIVFRDGRWAVSGQDLWNEYLDHVVEYRLRGLSDQVRRALLAVALHGPVSYERYLELGNDEVRAQMEDGGLVLVNGAEHPSVSIDVAHPIIAEYARRRGDSKVNAQAPVGHRFNAHPASSRAWSEWKRKPNKSVGLEVLCEAWGAAWDQTQLTAVFAQLDRLPDADEKTETRVEVMRLYWEMGNAQAAEVARGRFDSLAAEYPGSRHYFEAAKFVADALWHRLDATYRQQMSGSDADSMAAKAFLFLIDLRPNEALETLAKVSQDEVGGLFNAFLSITHSLALNLTGESVNAVDSASEAVSSAKKNLEKAPYLMAALAYATVANGRGLVSEAMEVIGGVLELREATFGCPGVYLALSQLGGKLAGEQGGALQSDLLLRDVNPSLGLAGPLPFMDARYAEVFSRSLTGDARGCGRAADVAALIAEDAMSRGYAYAAAEAMHVALLSRPERTLVDKYEALLHSRGIHVRDQFCQLVRLVVQGSWQGALDLVNDWRETNTLHDAARLLMNVVASADSTVSQGLLPLGRWLKRTFPDAMTGHLENRYGGGSFTRLSPRELEIVQLAESKSNRQIATLLGLSVRTVENHIYNALRKAGVQRRQDLYANRGWK